METMSFIEQQEAFSMVQRMLSPINPDRISRSDAKTYMAVILDNNSHRTICRLYLNARHKYIGTISDRKVETRTMIDSIYDINAFSSELNETARRYMNKY